jgi:hypothetical protein
MDVLTAGERRPKSPLNQWPEPRSMVVKDRELVQQGLHPRAGFAYVLNPLLSNRGREPDLVRAGAFIWL